MTRIQSSVTLPLVIRDQVLDQHGDELGLGVSAVPRFSDDAVQL